MHVLHNVVKDLQFSETERARIAQIATALVSGGAVGRDSPPAEDAEVHGPWMDRVLAARPDLARAMQRVALVPGTVAEVPASMAPQELEDVRHVVAAAYLINPEVRQLLGYPAGVRARQPAYPDEADSYLDDGILDAVIARGPIYRPDLE